MRQWVGHSAQELIATWGPPSEVLRGPGRTRMIVYHDHETVNLPTASGEAFKLPAPEEKANSEQVPAYLSANPPTGSQRYNYSSTRVFYVDEHGVIYRFKSAQGAAPAVQR